MSLSQKLLFFIKKPSLRIMFLLIVYGVVAPYLPYKVHQSLYTLSLLIKDILLWMMPVTVCFFIAQTVTLFERRAALFVVILLIFEGLSNFASVWFALGTAHFLTDWLPVLKQTTLSHDFKPLWRLPNVRPVWWGADKGCFLGLSLGILSGFYHNKYVRNFVAQGKARVENILITVFSPLIPVFILGFIARLYQTHLLQYMAVKYGIIIFELIVILVVYISLLFIISARGPWSNIKRHILNILPAGITALSSGCSLSTMPLTISGTAKHLDQPEMAQAIIPATTNIQQIGDCIVNTFLCFALYKNFYGINPTWIMLLHFSLAFIVARFATVAVNGGAIFIMLPIYEAYLNFNPEMIALILAFNAILDPIVTSSNVMANGALCRLFERVWYKIQTSKRHSFLNT